MAQSASVICVQGVMSSVLLPRAAFIRGAIAIMPLSLATAVGLRLSVSGGL